MRMHSLLSLAASAALTGAATAQVPYGFLVTAESNTAPDGFRIVDPATGAVTDVSEPDGNFLGGAQCVAIAPGTNSVVTSAGGSFGGAPIWNVPLTNNFYYYSSLAGQALPLFGSLARMHATSTETLLTLSSVSDGLYRQAGIPGTTTLLAPLSNATDICVIGNLAYVNSYSPGQPSTILEVDLASGTVNTVGTGYATIRSLGTLSGTLIGGRDDGTIVAIDVATGVAAPLIAPGVGSITAIVEAPSGMTYFSTDANSIYEFGNPTVPVYTSPYQLKDFDISFDDQATQLIYGPGCAGAAAAPDVAITAPPALGTTYDLTMTGAASNSIGGAVVGLGRADVNLGVIGYPNCTLVADFQLILTVITSQFGDATVSLTVPPTPALAGTHVNGQFFVLEAGGTLAMSPAVEGHIR